MKEFTSWCRQVNLILIERGFAPIPEECWDSDLSWFYDDDDQGLTPVETVAKLDYIWACRKADRNA